MENSQKLKTLINIKQIDTKTSKLINDFKKIKEEINIIFCFPLFELRRSIIFGAPFDGIFKNTENIRKQLGEVEAELFRIKHGQLNEIEREEKIPSKEIHYLCGIASKIVSCLNKITEFHYNIERGIDFQTYEETNKTIGLILANIEEELDLNNF